MSFVRRPINRCEYLGANPGYGIFIGVLFVGAIWEGIAEHLPAFYYWVAIGVGAYSTHCWRQLNAHFSGWKDGWDEMVLGFVPQCRLPMIPVYLFLLHISSWVFLIVYAGTKGQLREMVFTVYWVGCVALAGLSLWHIVLMFRKWLAGDAAETSNYWI